MLDLIENLKPVSLKFQQDYLLACEVPRVIAQLKSNIEGLSIVRGKNMEKLVSEQMHVNDNKEVEFKEVVLNKPSGRRESDIEHTPDAYFEHFDEFFTTIIDLTIGFLDNRFNDFSKTPLKEMVTIFDFKEWPKSFGKENKKWGLEEVQSVANYYCTHKFITIEEKSKKLRQWLTFRTKVHKTRNELPYEVYTDILKEKDPDLDAISILLSLMMTISTSTAACERGFSAMNLQKTNQRTQLSQETLDNIMRISIDGPLLSNFNACRHVNSWRKKSKRSHHEDGHKITRKKAKH